MSTDLELFQDVSKIKLTKLKIQSNSNENGIVINQEEENKKNDHLDDDDDDQCSTPTSEENKIPPVLSCPPAPKKPKKIRAASCKRKLSSDLQFFEIFNRDEVDAFFKSAFGDSLPKRRCSCT